MKTIRQTTGPGGALRGRGSAIKAGNPFDHLLYEAEPGQEQEAEGTGTRYLKVYPKTVINRVNSPDIPSGWSMNPYQGCEHGCAYCYARNSHEFWGYDAGLDFERVVLVKEDAPALFERELQSKSWKAEPVMLSGNTDCYQPIERKMQITRRILEICARYRQPVGIITKNSLVLRDLDILADLASDNLVHVAISVTGTDEKLRSLLEPRTSTYTRRIRAIEALSDRGVPVSVMMAPVIPSINTDAIAAVGRQASDAGALALGYTAIRLNGRVEPVFRDWLERHFPDRAERVMRQIAGLHGGKPGDSRFGVRMRGEGQLAAVIKQQFDVVRNLYFRERKMPGYNSSLFRRRLQLSLF